MAEEAEVKSESIEKKNPKVTDLMLAEYQQLRAEILKHMDIANQVIAITLVAFGTISATAFQSKAILLILIYPIIAMFLSMLYAHSDYRIRQIGCYIRCRMEAKESEKEIYWETYMHSSRKFEIYYFGTWGIFLVSPILAILGSFIPLTSTDSKMYPNFVLTILRISASISVFITAVFIAYYLWRINRVKDELEKQFKVSQAIHSDR